ncbi:MAG: glycosyltransferase, partial [Propionibacterium sp.]|nr:glycosyltransferase [Propionibacterium sp.]
MSRVLVVSPGFHGYGRAIADCLGQAGHDVTLHIYDAASRQEKAWNKVRHELPARVRGTESLFSEETVTRRAVDAVRRTRPDLVLTVRGDVLGSGYWDAVSGQTLHSVVWLYDELRRMHHDVNRLATAARIATYSALDAAHLRSSGIDARYVPLAYDATILPEGAGPAGVVTFVGARFAAREQILRALMAHGIPVKAYGRSWAGHPVDRMRTWRLGDPDPIPAGRDIALSQAYAIMRDGAATLNIHGDQDGFTMRTFEACGIGAVQIIDRDDVAEFYEPGTEVLVQHSPEEAVELCRMVLADPARMTTLREKARARTLAEHTLSARVSELEEMW